jgi:hypothetical protein
MSQIAWEQRLIPDWSLNVTIPRMLKPGNYVIRHEVVNLDNKYSAHLFPNCAQLEFSGDGDAVPYKEYLVEFPGVYSDDDPGFAIARHIF